MRPSDHSRERDLHIELKDELSYFCQIRASLIGASILLTLDAAISGSLLYSVFVCPIWFLISLARTALRWPGRKVGLSRIAAPVLTLGLVLVNARLQSTMASTNADRIIRACEQFRAANGEYPERLTELVPRYLESVPRAKYCLMLCDFTYTSGEEDHTLMWTELPPFGRRIYNLERGRWKTLD